MKTIYDKMTDALNQIDGNLMLDPGVKFFVKEIAPYFEDGDRTRADDGDEPGKECEECDKVIGITEFNRNAGVCDNCAINGEIK